mmetsp:Transcript_6723/g.16129  ORF Transcript_6723/g.16129 Transcript_6723/m.16129 type:complete len:200 (-) Transcript_6723:818-1417(-)
MTKFLFRPRVLPPYHRLPPSDQHRPFRLQSLFAAKQVVATTTTTTMRPSWTKTRPSLASPRFPSRPCSNPKQRNKTAATRSTLWSRSNSSKTKIFRSSTCVTRSSAGSCCSDSNPPPRTTGSTFPTMPRATTGWPLATEATQDAIPGRPYPRGSPQPLVPVRPRQRWPLRRRRPPSPTTWIWENSSLMSLPARTGGKRR